MRYSLLLLLLCTLVVSGCAKPESLVMRPATSPEGWNGNAFYRNGIIASEEFATGRSGYNTDVWRFYDNYGRLYTEEFDTTGDGRRNVYRNYDKNGTLVILKEDTTGDGVYDNRVDYRQEKESCDINMPKTTTTRVRSPKQPRAKRVKTPKSSRNKTPRINNNYSAKIAPPPSSQILTPAPIYAPEYPAPTAPAPRQPTMPSGDNWIRPLTMPQTPMGDMTNANARVVPGPVFQHPSDGLDD